MITWSSVVTSLQSLAAHSLLFTFSILLLFKLDHIFQCSWWIIFLPLWLFHAVVARGRFSLPAPSVPHDRHWAPFHAVIATPLLIAFELLLCINLESAFITGSANLKVVFLPLLAFEAAIFLDNFRMCKALLPGGNESMSDEAVWEALPRLVYAITKLALLFLPALLGGNFHGLLFAATVFTLLKLSGGVDVLGWWDLFIYFCIAEFFAFLLCTKWHNPMIHVTSNSQEASSSSSTIAYLGHSGGLVVSSEDPSESDVGCCFLPDIGGHIMKIPVMAFQLLLCMRLEGTPTSAKNIPLGVVFSPLLLLQGVGLLFSASRFTEKIVLFLRSGAHSGTYFTMPSPVYELFEFLHHGSRFLGWWSIDEASREEQARLYSSGSSSYKTFCKYPPEIVKKMPKKDLAEEVFRLQAALGEQSEITKFSQQEYERLQSEKVLCRVCVEGEISIVLLPCRHRILCRCKKCPICRVSIEERLVVYDV